MIYGPSHGEEIIKILLNMSNLLKHKNSAKLGFNIWNVINKQCSNATSELFDEYVTFVKEINITETTRILLEFHKK